MDRKQTESDTNLLTIETENRTPAEIVRELLAVEKAAKKQKISYSFEQLIGTWRLHFVTGTKKSRKRAGVVLGAGKFLPKFLKITITYQAEDSNYPDRSTVENCVDIGLLKLSLSGLVKFISASNILAFDFTRIKFNFLGLTLYEGYIKGGQEKEQTFLATPLKKQAFFTYFVVRESLIAARGRGGGLAIWTR